MNLRISLLLLSFTVMSNSLANTGVSFDLLYPVGSILINERNEFDSDIRIDWGFKKNWSVGTQLNFIKSSEEDSAVISSTLPANEGPQFHQVRDRSMLIFGRWYKSGYSESSPYFGLGAGFASREFSVFEGGNNKRDSSDGAIYSGQLGYQWVFISSASLEFEINYSRSSVAENIKGSGLGYSYEYNKDLERIRPKIFIN